MARKSTKEEAVPEQAEQQQGEGVKLRPVFKAMFALAGVILGLAGIVLTILFYFTVLSAVNGAQSAFDSQIGTAGQALSDLEGSIAAAEQTASSLSGATGNMTAAVSSASTASAAAADSFGAVAAAIGAVPLLPPGTASGLSSAAADMRNASDSFSGASASLANMSASSAELQMKLAAMRGDITATRGSLSDAQSRIDGSFGSLRLAALLLSLMLLIAFVMLGGYSASILL